MNPKPALNDEYLKQEVAEAEAAKSQSRLTFATPEVKEALLAGMAASEKVLKSMIPAHTKVDVGSWTNWPLSWKPWMVKLI